MSIWSGCTESHRSPPATWSRARWGEASSTSARSSGRCHRPRSTSPVTAQRKVASSRSRATSRSGSPDEVFESTRSLQVSSRPRSPNTCGRTSGRSRFIHRNCPMGREGRERRTRAVRSCSSASEMSSYVHGPGPHDRRRVDDTLTSVALGRRKLIRRSANHQVPEPSAMSWSSYRPATRTARPAPRTMKSLTDVADEPATSIAMFVTK